MHIVYSRMYNLMPKLSFLQFLSAILIRFEENLIHRKLTWINKSPELGNIHSLGIGVRASVLSTQPQTHDYLVKHADTC